jgi:hypothetical protein
VLQLGAASVDSGCGTPESFEKVLVYINRMDPEDSDVDSCGLHDLQSIFRLPIQHYIGNGGLGNRNCVQAIHSVYDLINTFCDLPGSWLRAIKTVFQQLRPNEDIPQELLKAIQEPLITRWWTLRKVAKFILKFWDIIQIIASTVVSSANTN